MSASQIAGALASLADRLWSRRPRAPAAGRRPVLLIVEGRYDVEFLRRISRLVASQRPDLPNLAELEAGGKLIFIPAGGDFVPWLHRLAGFGFPEVHVYDREVPPVTQQRQAGIAAVNRRPGCRAFLTRQRALENYLHPDAIREARGFDLAFSDQDDVAALAAQAAFDSQHPGQWQYLSRRARQRLRNRAKAWLNTAAVDRMTPARLAERNPAGEIQLWLETIARYASNR